MDKNDNQYYYDDSLSQFEEANITTESIYELDKHQVLIILDDGTNLTSYDDVPDKGRVIFISEDLRNHQNLNRRYNYPNLRALVACNVSGIVKSTSYMFYSCNNLTTISGLDTWDTGNIEDMHGMFKNCNKLTRIHSMRDWDLSNVRDTSYMFENCGSLSSLSDLKCWDMSNVNDMTAMFRDCTGLKNLDGLTNWKLQSAKSMERMFENCMELECIDSVNTWSISHDVNVEKIFKDCLELDCDIEDLMDKWLSNDKIDDITTLKESATTDEDKTLDDDINLINKSSYDDNLSTETINEEESERFFDFYYSSDLDYIMKVLQKEYERIK